MGVTENEIRKFASDGGVEGGRPAWPIVGAGGAQDR